MKELVDNLRQDRKLSADQYRALLLCQDGPVLQHLQQQAQDEAVRCFGRGIYIRGLIEVNNRCQNDCLYCGIRRSNHDVARYELSFDEIMACCEQGHSLGFRTFVLQGGQLGGSHNERMVQTVTAIRSQYPDCAITLSLGEKSTDLYQRLYNAGANRYLLRHETHNNNHYAQLHPPEMVLQQRLQCLDQLRHIGFQTGTGIMVGSPHQTIDHLVEDLLYIEQFCPQMIGIGPFIPHCNTPLGRYPAGSVEQTLKMLSIFRLMHPSALIPATTALATLAPNGRERGILAGANVVMPNLSPVAQRANYALYNNKASLGAEAAEGLQLLEEQLTTIGYYINKEKGDYEL